VPEVDVTCARNQVEVRNVGGTARRFTSTRDSRRGVPRRTEGLRDIFVLVFLQVETRRVFVSPATFKTGDAWMREIVA